MIRIMDSHLYPGCRAVMDEGIDEGPGHAEFSDGTVAGARTTLLGEDRIALTIDRYRTGSGSEIETKSWLLERQDGDRWRVIRRLQDDP